MDIPQQWQTILYDEHIHDMQTRRERRYDKQTAQGGGLDGEGSLVRPARFGLGSRLGTIRQHVHSFHSATRTQP
jgi:hypothetical protein